MISKPHLLHFQIPTNEDGSFDVETTIKYLLYISENADISKYIMLATPLDHPDFGVGKICKSITYLNTNEDFYPLEQIPKILKQTEWILEDE